MIVNGFIWEAIVWLKALEKNYICVLETFWLPCGKWDVEGWEVEKKCGKKKTRWYFLIRNKN